MKLKLKAKTDYEKMVLDYLEANVSDVLGAKINAGEKTMQECWAYIKSEARKHAKNGCACIDDATVYGWAIHFFEEDGIVVEAPAPEQNTEHKVEKVAKKEKPKKQEQFDQLSFDDLFGG